MALVSYDLFGVKHDKEERAIEIVKSFEPPEGFYLAFSGGKDSAASKQILDLAGVKYDTHYNVTTVDPPELVRHIISQFEYVIYDMPDGSHKYFSTHGPKLLNPISAVVNEGGRTTIHFTIPTMPMRKLIVKKLFPPTQKCRYCCEHLKEANGEGRIVVTGVRWAESTNRKKNQGMAVVWSNREKQPKKVAEENGARYTLNKRNCIILNYDDAAARRTVEMCYRTNKTLVNPIIDFDEDDVWELIHKYNLPYCKLYDEGFKRIGCVGCPMGRGDRMKRDFDRWPQFRRMYERAFNEMLAERNRRGLKTQIGTNGAEIMQWWLGLFDTDRKNELDQMSIDDLEEIIWQ